MLKRRLASQLPPPEPQARWASTATECCTLHYITGTAAERDLQSLALMLEEQANHAAGLMGVDFSEKVVLTLMPRLLGHGGFANGEIRLSYLDRNYAGGNLEMILRHELVHILDQRLGGDLRPSMLVEGLAVYLTGGHFKPDLLLPRAAALLEAPGGLGRTGLDRFIPLNELADQFYKAQHEAGSL